MNAPVEHFILKMPDFRNEIVETIIIAEPPRTPAMVRDAAAVLRWKASRLQGYEATMRRHAIACEAGR